MNPKNNHGAQRLGAHTKKPLFLVCIEEPDLPFRFWEKLDLLGRILSLKLLPLNAPVKEVLQRGELSVNPDPSPTLRPLLLVRLDVELVDLA